MKLTTILLGCHLTGCLLAADLKIENELPLVSSRHTNTVKLSPGPDDAQIARLAARIMERSHYSQQPLDETVSSKFFDRYFDALDPARLLFLLSDIAEFERWRPKLGELTVKLGDTSPAEMIFNRFMERYDQHIIFMTNQVATGKFEFTGDDRYVLNRKELSRPKDLNEAKKNVARAAPLRIPPGEAQQGKAAGDRQDHHPPLQPPVADAARLRQ